MSNNRLVVTANVDLAFNAKVYGFINLVNESNVDTIVNFAKTNGYPGVVEMVRTNDVNNFVVNPSTLDVTHTVSVEFPISRAFSNIAESNAYTVINNVPVLNFATDYTVHVTSILNTDEFGPNLKSPLPRISSALFCGRIVVNEAYIVSKYDNVTSVFLFALKKGSYTESEILYFVDNGDILTNTNFVAGINNLGARINFSPSLTLASGVYKLPQFTIKYGFNSLTNANDVSPLQLTNSGDYELFIVYKHASSASKMYKYYTGIVDYSDIYTLPYDLLYRIDALNVSGYVLDTNGNVIQVKDLSDNVTVVSGLPYHEHEHLVCKDPIPLTGGSSPTPLSYSPMTLDFVINGNPGFNSSLKQGSADRFDTTADGNIRKSNVKYDFTLIHICKLPTSVSDKGYLVSYGLVNFGLGLYLYSNRATPVFAMNFFTNAEIPSSSIFGKNIIFIYRVCYNDELETSYCNIKAIEIDTGIVVHDGSETLTGSVLVSLFLDDTAAPFFIGSTIGTFSTSYNSVHIPHVFGETILYNDYVSDAHTSSVIDLLVKKWKVYQFSSDSFSSFDLFNSPVVRNMSEFKFGFPQTKDLYTINGDGNLEFLVNGTLANSIYVPVSLHDLPTENGDFQVRWSFKISPGFTFTGDMFDMFLSTSLHTNVLLAAFTRVRMSGNLFFSNIYPSTSYNVQILDDTAFDVYQDLRCVYTYTNTPQKSINLKVFDKDDIIVIDVSSAGISGNWTYSGINNDDDIYVVLKSRPGFVIKELKILKTIV